MNPETQTPRAAAPTVKVRPPVMLVFAFSFNGYGNDKVTFSDCAVRVKIAILNKLAATFV